MKNKIKQLSNPDELYKKDKKKYYFLALLGALSKAERDDPERFKRGDIDGDNGAFIDHVLSNLRSLERAAPPIRDRLDKNKQAELDELLVKLQSWEDRDPGHMSVEFKELRNNVLKMHSFIETWLDSRINDYLLKPFQKLKPTYFDRMHFYGRLVKILQGLDFGRKVTISEKIGIIGGGTLSIFFEVNDYRIFSLTRPQRQKS